MGVEAEAEVRLAVPVFEVVARVVAGVGEVGDLVLRDAGGFKAGAGELVEVGGIVVGGEGGGAVASAGGEGFAAEAGVFVELEQVDA